MITLAILCSFAMLGYPQSGAKPTASPSWTVLMERSAPKVKPVAALKPRPGSIHRGIEAGSKSANQHRLSPEEEAAIQALWTPFIRAIVAGMQQFDQGNYERAASILEGARAGVTPVDMGPSTEDERLLNLLADCYFRLNQPGQAFAALSPHASEHELPPYLLRASLAAARTGRVYAGQRAYLIRYLSRHEVPDTAQWFRQGNSPAAIEALSCLALATDESGNSDKCRYYASEALRLDPGNPIACDILGHIAEAAHHFQAAADLFSTGLARASGDRLNFMRKDRDDCLYWHGLTGG